MTHSVGKFSLGFSVFFLLFFALYSVHAFTVEEIYYPEQAYYIVTYPSEDPTLIADVQEHLQAVLTIEAYVPEHQYIVYAATDELDLLQTEGYITDYVSYYDVVDNVLLEDGDFDHYILHLFTTAPQETITQQLDAYGIATLDSSTETHLIIPQKHDPTFLRTIQGVAYVSTPPQLGILNHAANTISGTPHIRNQFGLYGQNVTVAVSDTGLDTGKNDASMHDDIEGRIVSISNLGRASQPYDKNGHGTHVTGSILGTGVKSGSNPKNKQYGKSFAGVAPQASLVFQAIGDDLGSLNVYPPSPYDTKLFNPPYQSGARIHSNSWGSIGSFWHGLYDTGSQEVDRFMRNQEDMLIVYAAGNDGLQGYGTVVPPSTAKNGLSVGGVDTDNPNRLYTFSSKGYTRDGRVKPDIVAAATNIISTRSSVGMPCLTPQNNPHYCIYSGTSMATPHVAGLTTLIREYYPKYFNHQPSAALVKATLLNGAEDIGYGIPSKEAGWGRANIKNSLPPIYEHTFYDVQQGLTTGKKKTFTLPVLPGKPLKVMLVWTDHEAKVFPLNGKKLVNDLDLVVVDPKSNKYNGNDVTAPYNDQVDRINNVERVAITTPQKGTYTIEVHGYNIPKNTQNFALVASFNNANLQPAPAMAICITANGTKC